MPICHVRRMVFLSVLFLCAVAGGTQLFAAGPRPKKAPPAPPEPVEKMVWPAWQIPAAKVDPKLGLSIEPDAAAESIRTADAVKAERAAAAKRGVKPDENLPEPKDEPVALVQRVIRSEIANHVYPIVATPVINWETLKPGVYRVS